MAFYSLTDEAIATEIGRRLKTLRLNKNYSQEEMIEKTRVVHQGDPKCGEGEKHFGNIHCCFTGVKCP